MAKTTPQHRIFPKFHDYCESSVKSTTNNERTKMFNFKFPWTKRREARQAAEQKARDDAAWRAIIDTGKHAEDRRRLDAQRVRASAIEPPLRAGLASVPFDGYTAQGGAFTGAPERVTALPAGGGTFDGGGASGDWSGSSCSSSSSDSSSGSSDSGSSCSSD